MTRAFYWSLLFSVKTMVLAQGFSCHPLADTTLISGELGKFQINGDGLRLKDEGAGEALIFLHLVDSPQTVIIEGQLDFSPSSSNAFGLIIPVSGDSMQTPFGHMLHLGSSGNEDRVTWHVWDSGQKGPPLDTAQQIHGGLAVTPISWKLTFAGDTLHFWSREKRGLRWRPEGSFSVYSSGVPDSIGIWMRYTSTRKDKISLLSWCAGNADHFPRVVEWWEAPMPGICRFYFGRPVSLSGDFSLELLPGIIPPIGINTDSLDLGMLEAEWDPTAMELRNGPVVIKGLLDENSTALPADTVPVYWFLATRAETRVIISEIMADPEPSRGWPASEFVELYNFGPDTLFAENWSLGDSRSQGDIPAFRLPPGGFMVLVPETDVGEWIRLGVPSLGIRAWPGYNNDEDLVVIFDGQGQIVDSVQYRSVAAEPKEKQGGGWSLSRTTDPCQRTVQWLYTEEDSGASPGKAGRHDSRCPARSLDMKWSGDQLLIYWSRYPEGTPDYSTIAVSGKHPLRSISESPDDVGIWILEWEGKPAANDTLRLAFEHALNDRCGNILWPAGQPIPLDPGVPPAPGELVINELMLQPAEADRFLELYNAGNRPLRTDELIVNFPTRSEWWDLSDHGVIYPGQYIALTPSPCLVNDFYRAPDSVLLEYEDFTISWSLNDTTIIELIRSDGFDWELVDRVAYHPDWHRPDLQGRKDVSLERLSPGQSGMLASNWSSSLLPGRSGTPGWQNSRGRQYAGDGSRFDLTGAIDPGRPDSQWELQWSLPNGEWEMMAELFTMEGKYLGIIMAPGPVVASGAVSWGLEHIGRLTDTPGAYLLSLTCWSSEGKYIRRTLYGLLYPS